MKKPMKKLMKKRKKRKAALKKDKAGKVYFSVDTEAAIVAYNESEDSEEREVIFRENIYKALDKLAENVINRFKFPYINYSFEDIKQQVVSFLVINLHKYTKNKGKAFSYFSVIAKNYLILHNNNSYKNDKRSVYLSDIDVSDTLEPGDTEEPLMIDFADKEAKLDMKEFSRLMIRYWEENSKKVFKKERDIKIVDAIIQLFRDSESIENFNKKALYILIREQTNYETSAITKVVNKMRIIMLKHLKQYKITGKIS